MDLRISLPNLRFAADKNRKRMGRVGVHLALWLFAGAIGQYGPGRLALIFGFIAYVFLLFTLGLVSRRSLLSSCSWWWWLSWRSWRSLLSWLWLWLIEYSVATLVVGKAFDWISLTVGWTVPKGHIAIYTTVNDIFLFMYTLVLVGLWISVRRRLTKSDKR
jgi:hypothetical protein